MNGLPAAFWSLQSSELSHRLQTTPQGLTSEEAGRRLKQFGANRLKPKKRSDALSLLLSQFKSPLVILLLCAAGLSFLVHDSADAMIILSIVLISGLLGFWQERGATNAVEKLLAIVQIKATLMIAGITVILPYTGLGTLFGFTPLPMFFILAMGLIVALYILAAEVVKRSFFKRVKF